MANYVATGLTVTFSGFSGEVVDVDYGGATCETVDVTHQESSSYFREYLAGLRDGGEVTLTVNFDPTTTSLSILGAKGALTLSRAGWSKSLSCSAICTGVGGISGSLGQKVTTRITFKITGVPQFS